MAFILVAHRRTGATAVCNYLGKRGVTVYDAAKAAIYKTIEAARDEMEYFVRVAPVYRWTIERLPAGRGTARFLRAVPVEGEGVAS